VTEWGCVGFRGGFVYQYNLTIWSMAGTITKRAEGKATRKINATDKIDGQDKYYQQKK
jgi:hypothetical protein